MQIHDIMVKDLDTFDRFNKELIGDLNTNSGIIDCNYLQNIFKIQKPICMVKHQTENIKSRIEMLGWKPRYN